MRQKLIISKKESQRLKKKAKKRKKSPSTYAIAKRKEKKQGFTPMLFQCILWGKYSTWEKPKKNLTSCLKDF